MSRLLGYMCSDDSLTPYAMGEVRREAWGDEAAPLATLGFGWVQESRTLLRKHPSDTQEPVDVLGLLADVPARTIVGHARDPDDGTVDALDLQPFRFRKWVFAQSGSAPEFEGYRDALLGAIPDHIRRNIKGKTDAEVILHFFYHRMKENGALSGGRASARLAAQALAATLAEVEQHAHRVGHEGPISIDIVAATERLLVCGRTGEAIHYRIFRGIEQPGEEPLFAGHRPKKIQHPHFRGVFLASHLQPGADHWSEVPAHNVAWIDGDWEPHTGDVQDLLAD